MQTTTKKPIGRIVLIAVGGFILFCIGCLIFGSLLPEPTQDPADVQATAEALAWQSITQTAEAIPTFTPTIAITNTPVPTATLTIDLYRTELAERFSTYNEAIQDFFELTIQVSEDQTKLFDEEWRLRTAVSLVVLDAAATELENIPGLKPEYETLDSYIKAIAQETHLLVANYTSGIDNLDVNALNRATSNINLITQYSSLATDEINKLNSP